MSSPLKILIFQYYQIYYINLQTKKNLNDNQY